MVDTVKISKKQSGNSVVLEPVGQRSRGGEMKANTY